MKTLIKKTLLVLMVAFIAVFTLGVTSKVKAASYVETSFGEGKLFITSVFEGQKCYLPATTTSSGPVYKTFSDVSEISDDHLWTVTATGSNYYIQNSEGKYLYTINDNNGVRVSTTKNAWTYDSKNNSLQDSVTKRFLGVYSSKNWRSYKTVNASNYKESSTSFKFYKIDSGEPSLILSGDSHIEMGKTSQLTAQLTNLSGSVVWASSDESILSVDVNGVVSANALGTAVITGKVNDIQSSIEIKVYPSTEKEYSIAEIIDICEYTGTTNTPYLYSTTGKIKSIDSVYNSQYKNIDVTISDGVDSIKVYRMVGGEELLEGQTIKVTGALVNYQGNTPEFAQGCTYEVIVDDSTSDILAELNSIAAYMSLAYKYNTDQQEVIKKTYTEKKLTFDDTSKRTEYSNEKQVWVENGVTVTNEKSSSTNNVGDYVDPARFYKSSTLNVEAENEFTSLVFTCANETYAAALVDSISDGNVVVNGPIVTIKLSAATTSFVIESLTGGQVRVASVSVFVEDENSTNETELTTVYSEVDFRIKCGVDKALTSLTGLTGDEKYDWGISVTANGQTKYYNSTSEFIVSDDENNKKYVIISLGDVLNEVTKAKTEFTVRAYVEVDGDKYVSTEFKTYSVESMIKEYNTNEKYSDYKTQIAPLVEALTSLGCNVE